MKYYVDCVQGLYFQYPVVRTKEKIIARKFKGVMFEECEARAERLAQILNNRAYWGGDFGWSGEMRGAE